MSDAKEKALVERVELRLALANTDDKFQHALNVFLAPLLLKFASPHSSVRQEVGKTIQFILTKINSSLSVQLPVESLLTQVQKPELPEGQDPTIVQSYTLVFLSKGINRLSTDQQAQLIPKVISQISQYKPAVSARVFNVLCRLILNYDTATINVDDGKKFRDFLLFDADNKGQEDFLIETFAKFMLLQPVHLQADGQIPRNVSLPGLSNADCAYFTYNAGVTFDAATLADYKKSIIRFVQYGFNKDSNLVLFVASADTNSSVADLASNLFRRKAVDPEDEFLVDSLMSLFLGDKDIPRPPARLVLQEKIVNFLCKSKRAAKSPLANEIITVGLSSDYGKLKHATVNFVRFVTTEISSSGSDSAALSLDMANQLKTNLTTGKQAEVTSNMSEYLLQRRYQYEALELILRKSPKAADFSMVSFLFEMLRTEIPELRQSAQEALSSMTSRLSELPDSQKEQLKQFLKSVIEQEHTGKVDSSEQSARFVATKFVNCAFPFSDAEARLLDIVVQTSREKPETLEEAGRGLHPYWFTLIQSSDDFKPTSELVGPRSMDAVQFPSFGSLVGYLGALHTNIDKAIVFVLRCLVMDAIRGKKTCIVIDTEWENRVETAVEFDPVVRSCLTKRLALLSETDSQGDVAMGDESTALEQFMKLCFANFIETKNIDVGKHLVTVLSLCPPSLVGKLVENTEPLLDCLNEAFSDDLSLYISKMLGILCSHSVYSDQKLEGAIAQLLNAQEVRPLGYIVSRLTLTGRSSLVDVKVLEQILSLAKGFISGSSSTKLRGSIDSISQLSMFGCLGPVQGTSAEVKKLKEELIEEIKPLIKKRQEDAVAMCWSFLALSGVEGVDFQTALYESHTSKHLDYMFSVGEAFTVLANGWKSHIMDGKIDIQDPLVDVLDLVPSENKIAAILDTVLEACSNTKPALRRAGCIWLLSFVQYCGDSDEVRARLPQIQLAFTRLLTDREELIQESASRGLSLVYEQGNYELKDELVHNLLLSFTDSNKTSKLISGSIGSDTKLFEPGVLKTDDGSVSTYKDIINLASEVGDPSLVYKFMSLAKNSALWSSRKGIAYGLGAILDKSKLDEMLQKDSNLTGRLIPKLYRYRFDPSPSVSKVMDDIWTSLILDSKKTVQDNFGLILKDLLKGMGNREWRMRQASAAALNDLLRHVPLTTYEGKLSEIWTMAFRSMDDIKDSVRKEGNLLTRYLATTMVSKISDGGKGSGESLKQLIPFLLGSNGLLSDADDVKSFAFDTIMKIAETSSIELKPFVNDMITEMVTLMSSVEPQVVNYLSLNADKYKLKSDDIDSQRLNMVGTSPMMGAIEKLLDLLDESLMPDFLSKLSNAVKTAVGLPSKVTGSKVIVDLVVKHFFVVQNFGDDLLKIAIGQLKNHNDTISGSYAIAAGYCVRIASVKKVHTLSKKLKRYYFEAAADSNHLQKVSSRTCAAVADFSKDKFQSVASAFLPLAFVGKHDVEKDVSSGFKKAWESSIGSGSSAIKLYFSDVLELIKPNMETTNFALRKAMGLTVIEMVERLGPNVGTLHRYLPDLYNVLLKSLEGRYFSGKESLLNSLVLLSISSKSFLQEPTQEELYKKVQQRVLNEAQRKNRVYKKDSIKSLGKFLGAYPDDPAMYKMYIALVRPLLILSESSADSDSEMDTDSDTVHRNDSKKLKTDKQEEYRNSLMENAVIAVNRDEPNLDLVNFLLDDVLSVTAKEEHSYKTKLTTMNVLTELVNKLDHSSQLSGEAVKCLNVWTLLTERYSSGDNLQSVLISYIRLTKLVGTKLGEKDRATEVLNDLASQNINSVITLEARNAAKKLTT